MRCICDFSIVISVPLLNC